VILCYLIELLNVLLICHERDVNGINNLKETNSDIADDADSSSSQKTTLSKMVAIAFTDLTAKSGIFIHFSELEQKNIV